MNNSILVANEIGCSSFELKKTSRGYSWNIKVYSSDIQKGYELAKQVDQQAKIDYEVVIEEDAGG